MRRRDPRLALPGLASCSEAEDEFGVAEDRDVGVVRREDELAAALFLPHDWHHALRDEAVVEIVFGLIDYKWRFRFKQQEQQDGRCFLTGRERSKRLPIGRLPVGSRIQLDLRCRRQFELFNTHEQLQISLCDPLGGTGWQVVVLPEPLLAFPAPLSKFPQGQLVMSAQALERGGKVAADLAKELFERVTVAGHRNPDLYPVSELTGYPFRCGLELPVLSCLDVFPLCKKVAALGLVCFQIALEAFHLVVQRA